MDKLDKIILSVLFILIFIIVVVGYGSEKQSISTIQSKNFYGENDNNITSWSDLKTAIGNVNSNEEVTFYLGVGNWDATETITISENQKIILTTSDDITIFRGDTFKNALFIVKGSLTIKTENANSTITIDGNKNNVEAKNSLIVNKSNLILNNVILCNNKNENNGGAIYTYGNLTISGESKIKNNTARYGGGIMIKGGTTTLIKDGTTTLESGEISGNDAYCGGGIVVNPGKLIINGGSIIGNTADAIAGGVDYRNGIVELNGGEIKENFVKNNNDDYSINKLANEEKENLYTMDKFYECNNYDIMNWTTENLTNYSLKKDFSFVIQDSSVTGSTGLLQGMCITDKYIVFAQVTGDNVNTWLNIVDKNSKELVGRIDSHRFGHVNDITYNNEKKVFLIPRSDNTKTVYEFKITENETENEIDKKFKIDYLSEISTPRPYSALAYYKTDDEGSGYYIAYNKEIYILKEENGKLVEVKNFNAPTTLVTQGIAYNNNHIYFCCYEKGLPTKENNTYKIDKKECNLIYVYNMNGDLENTLYIPNTELSGEIESLDFDENGKMLVGYNIKIDGNKTVSFYSENLTSITINTDNAKKEYFIGDELNTEGIEVIAHYDDGREEVVTEGITYTGFDSSKAGMSKVTVNYCGKTTDYDVNINELIINLVENPQVIKQNVKIEDTTYLIVEEDTNVEEVLNDLQLCTDSFKLVVKENQVVPKSMLLLGDDILKTNQLVEINGLELNQKYIIVVKGDINSDGKVDFTDVVKLNNCRINETESNLNDAEKIALKSIKDNEITNSELEKIEFVDVVGLNNYRLKNN